MFAEPELLNACIAYTEHVPYLRLHPSDAVQTQCQGPRQMNESSGQENVIKM